MRLAGPMGFVGGSAWTHDLRLRRPPLYPGWATGPTDVWTRCL